MVSYKDPDTERQWAELEQDPWDAELGAVAGLLQAAGHHKALALLLDVEDVHFRYVYEDWGIEWKRACLIVPPYLVGRFDEETCEQIKDALEKACYAADFRVQGVEAFPTLADIGWRDRYQEQLASGPRNQATLASLPKQFPRADGMAFRNGAELAVYQALKAEQESRPRDDTFSIVPNCSTRIPNRTWEPDFLVIFRGKCAAIEVDGGTHRGKYLSDKSRDDVLTDSGIAFVKRIDTAEVANAGEQGPHRSPCRQARPNIIANPIDDAIAT